MEFQDCVGLFGERLGVLPNKQDCHDWQPLVKQAGGCMASAFARLVADVGEDNAISLLERECGHRIPQTVIEAGVTRKARFVHMR